MHIEIDLKIIIFVLFFFILGIEDLYVLFLIFAIIHELCHMIMGVLLTFKISKLCIMPFGAYISFKINIKNYNTKILNGTICSLKKLFVALAGTIVIIAIITIVFCFLTKSFVILFTLVYLIYIRKKEDEIYRMKERAYRILENM